MTAIQVIIAITTHAIGVIELCVDGWLLLILHIVPLPIIHRLLRPLIHLPIGIRGLIVIILIRIRHGRYWLIVM